MGLDKHLFVMGSQPWTSWFRVGSCYQLDYGTDEVMLQHRDKLKIINCNNIFRKKSSFFGISLWKIIFSSGPINFWNQQLEGFQKSIGFPMLSPKSDHIWFWALKWIAWYPSCPYASKRPKTHIQLRTKPEGSQKGPWPYQTRDSNIGAI